MAKTRKQERPVRIRVVALSVVVLCVSAGLLFWYLSAIGTEHWSAVVQREVERLDFDAAKQILLTEHQRDPEDLLVVQVMADVCAIEGNEEEAIEWLNRIPDSAAEMAPQARLDAAMRTMRLYRFQETQDLLARAIQLDPTLAQARRVLANLELNLLRPGEARYQIAEIDARGQATPDDICLFCVGDRLRYDQNENVQNLQTFLEKEPDNAIIIGALAQNYVRMDRRDEAIALLKKSAAKSTHSERWRLVLGIAEDDIAREDFAAAADRLATLPAAADILPRTWLARARALRGLGDLDSAIIAYTNASILDPFDPEPTFALSRIAGSRDEPEVSKQLLDRTKQLQRLVLLIDDALNGNKAEYSQHLLDIGKLLVQLGATREALVCFAGIGQTGMLEAEAAKEIESLTQSSTIPSWLTIARAADLQRVPSATVTRARPSEAVVRREGDSNAETSMMERFALEDVARNVGLDFDYFSGETEKRLLLTALGCGVALIDYDSDGWPDIFFPQAKTIPIETKEGGPADTLVRNLDGARFANVTDASLILPGGYGHGAAVGDVDNDGFEDLFVCNYGRNLLYRNNGDGTFDDVTDESGIEGEAWSTSAAFGDFDSDGDIDLYVVNYIDIEIKDMKQCAERDFSACGPANLPGRQDQYFENAGDGRFRDRTADAGIIAPDGKGLGVIAAHFDDDPWLDVFVGNDTSANFLFSNVSKGADSKSSAKFSEVAMVAGVACNESGTSEGCMGIAFGDANTDGLLDLFVTNFADETNTLYQNLGNLSFLDRAEEFGLGSSSFRLLGWGAQFIDVDGNGYLDLFLVNGHLHGQPMEPQLFASDQGRKFQRISDKLGGFFSTKGTGRGVAKLDWNGNLSPDLVITDQAGHVSLLENRSIPTNRIAVRLSGTKSNRTAIGTRVRIDANGQTYVKQLTGSSGYMAVNEMKLIFGLGSAERVDRLEVIWPSGETSRWDDLPANVELIVVEGREPVLTRSRVPEPRVAN